MKAGRPNSRDAQDVAAVGQSAGRLSGEERHRAGGVGGYGGNSGEDQGWEGDEGATAGDGIDHAGGKGSQDEQAVGEHLSGVLAFVQPALMGRTSWKALMVMRLR